ncbi:MAG: CRISPR-associated protein Cas4 [Candidatus Hodarchaeales archaeon]
MENKTSYVDQDLTKNNYRYKPRNNILWVTDITSPCLRAVYYERKQKTPSTVQKLRVFNAGRVLEDWWINLLERRQDTEIIATEMPCRHINPFYRIHGRADVVTQRNQGELEVHEIKTIKCFGSFLTEPKPEHVNQLQFYLNTLGIETGYIDYINKQTFINGYNTIDKRFQIKQNKRTYKRLLKRAHNLFGCLLADTPPKPEPCWKCKRNCPYLTSCRKKGKHELEKRV